MPRHSLMILTAALSTAMLNAAPPLTVIQDTLYKADGSRFDGIAQISWKSFRASDGSEIPAQSLSVSIANGAVRVALVPTTNALQMHSVLYTVKFNADGRTHFSELWAVPPSGATLRLRDVRFQGPPPGNITQPDGSVDIIDVPGLRTELDLRPGKGAGFSTSRAAIINASGAIDAAVGNLGDCIRVDGTAGPCGAGTGGLVFVDGESPNGIIDGVNTAFVLSATPTPANSLSLYRNGVLLTQGVDYAISGKNLVLTSGNVPVPGDRLQAWYRLPPTGIPAVEFADGETPGGTVNGVNQVFTLAATPMPASSLRVFRNGLLQKPGLDYELAVNTITFTSVSIPLSGDVLQVFYRR
jgi:hypothetical protein